MTKREELIDELLKRVPAPTRFSEAEMAEIREWLSRVLEVAPRVEDEFGTVEVMGLEHFLFTREVLEP